MNNYSTNFAQRLFKDKRCYVKKFSDRLMKCLCLDKVCTATYKPNNENISAFQLN